MSLSGLVPSHLTFPVIESLKKIKKEATNFARQSHFLIYLLLISYCICKCIHKTFLLFFMFFIWASQSATKGKYNSQKKSVGGRQIS